MSGPSDKHMASAQTFLSSSYFNQEVMAACLATALHAAEQDGLRRAADEASKFERTIAARDRRISRLVDALNYAREHGFRFPADDDPKVVLSEAEKSA